MDEFEKFIAKEGESLESVYERLTTLVNIMDCNNVRPIPVSINTSFSFACNLMQFEPHIQASKAKRAAKNHDPLALISHSNASSSQSHASPSYSHSPQPYNKLSTPTNNRLRTSSNTRNQDVIQDGRVDIQTKNAGYGRNGNNNAGRQNMIQVFNAGNGLTQNDECNQIVQRVPRTKSNPGKENVQCYNCNEKGHYARVTHDIGRNKGL
nr:hypothetical protein [Tanacetum cinerariifolium]